MCLTIATDAICCAGASFCSLACCCCKSCLGTTFKEQVKISYMLLNTLIMSITIITLYYVQESYSFYVKYIGCPPTTGGSDYCLGVSGIYRMSFSLAFMYFVLIFCMLFRGVFAKQINEGLWMLKIMIICGLFYTSLYIPNTFFEYYVIVCQISSGIYMIFQIIMMIDIFYLWAENWIKQYDDGNQCMSIALIITTLILASSSIILNVYNFIWFSTFPNLITCSLIVGMTFTQLMGYNPSGSLLTTSALALYISFQSYCAQSSLPDLSHNPFYDSTNSIIVQTSVGLVLNLMSLIYLIFATQEQSRQQVHILETERQKSSQPQAIEIELTYDQQIKEAKSLIEQDELLPYQSNQYVIYHLIMIITVMYLAMMITNWGAPSIKSETKLAYQPSWLSYYIKLLTAWSAALIYVWSLIAPKVIPERFES